jgi:NhaP-type Na+/H+ or K+/H+ antiporter
MISTTGNLVKYKNIFIPEEHKTIAAEHNAISNDVVGVFAFSMGIASLASNNPVGLATASFLFCAIWMAYKGLMIYSILRRVYKDVPWWKQLIDGFLYNFIYLLGFSFVGAIGIELITIETFKEWSIWRSLKFGN